MKRKKIYHIFFYISKLSPHLSCNMQLNFQCNLKKSNILYHPTEQKIFVLISTCAWKSDKLLTVCKGISTFTRNCLCSALRGKANPLIILEIRTEIFVSVIITENILEV